MHALLSLTRGLRYEWLAEAASPVQDTFMVAVDATFATSEVRPLTHELAARIPEIRAFRRRTRFERSALFAELRDEIERITFGVERGRAATAPDGQRRFLRVVAWNVERGKRLPEMIPFLREHPLLSRADIYLLAEVDIGMARSGNRNVARELADALGCHYVFGNSYLCLDGGNARDGDRGADNDLGLHGNAILSRYPIGEAENLSIAITKDKFHSSEKRWGHKKALCAEIDLPSGRLPVTVVHLDSGASPAQRGLQMRSLLDQLEARYAGQPLLVGGDLNTTTYDVKSPGRLVWNLVQKFARGGFPHAIEHYLYPQRLYERSVFAELERCGLNYGPAFNPPGIGTSRFDSEDPDAQSKVLDYVPRFVLRILQRKLRPWNGVAALKLDWFAGRGLRPLSDGEVSDGDGTGSIAPRVLEKPNRGRILSDHDIIAVDLALPA